MYEVCALCQKRGLCAKRYLFCVTSHEAPEKPHSYILPYQGQSATLGYDYCLSLFSQVYY